MYLCGKTVRSWCDGSMSDGSSDRSFMVDSLSCLLFRPVLHDWCNKYHGMCYPLWDDAYKRTFAANQKELAI